MSATVRNSSPPAPTTTPRAYPDVASLTTEASRGRDGNAGRGSARACLADQIALADQHLIVVPPSALAFSAVAPADDRPATGERARRELLEPQNLLHDRTLHHP